MSGTRADICAAVQDVDDPVHLHEEFVFPLCVIILVFRR
jgi:hypothetical protein